MKIETYFGHIVTLSLLMLSAAYRSPLFSYASVIALAFVMGKDSYDKVIATREAKATPDAELKRTISEINVRVARLEHGVATRGF